MPTTYQVQRGVDDNEDLPPRRLPGGWGREIDQLDVSEPDPTRADRAEVTQAGGDVQLWPSAGLQHH